MIADQNTVPAGSTPTLRLYLICSRKEKMMLAIRLYISALVLLFLFARAREPRAGDPRRRCCYVRRSLFDPRREK